MGRDDRASLSGNIQITKTECKYLYIKSVNIRTSNYFIIAKQIILQVNTLNTVSSKNSYRFLPNLVQQFFNHTKYL